jgi:multimeric flavodoxin WrbA
MFKLAIIVGTDRPNSKSQDMAVYVKEQYSKRGVDAHIFSMADFPLGSVVGGPYGKEIPEIEAFRAPILACDALLFVIPEYNGSFPGVLKVFIDYLPFPSGSQLPQCPQLSRACVCESIQIKLFAGDGFNCAATTRTTSKPNQRIHRLCKANAIASTASAHRKKENSLYIYLHIGIHCINEQDDR